MTRNTEPPDEKKATGNSFRKNLAVATVAASLGVSLGVPVGEVLAAGNNLGNPPGYSRQDKQNVASESMKSNQYKFRQSGQFKDTQRQSSQFKGSQNTRQSSQMKINTPKQASQIKINTPKQSSQIKLNSQGSQKKR